jgi:hypothetical protein
VIAHAHLLAELAAGCWLSWLLAEHWLLAAGCWPPLATGTGSAY